MLYNTLTKQETSWPRGLPIPAHIMEYQVTRPISEAAPMFRLGERAKLITYRQKQSIDGNKQLA